MSTAQPFPVLASADNSRSASPASSPPPRTAAQQRSTKSAGRGGGSKPRAKKPQGPASSNGEAAPGGGKRAGSNNNNNKQWATVAVAGPSVTLSTTTDTDTDTGLLAADNRQQQQQRKQRGPPPAPEPVAAPKRQQQPKTMRGGRRSTAEPAPAESVPPPPALQAIRSSGAGGGSLPTTAVIVAGENGRARVLFNPPAMEQHEYDDAADSPPPQFVGKPRFPAGSLQLRRSSMGHYSGGSSRMRYSSGDGLGLASPAHSAYNMPATARSVTTPPEFRQRSMTSTPLRVSAPVFTPQQQNQNQNQSHQLYQNQQQYQSQNQQLYQAPAREPPMSAPAYDGRGRSQSVSTHVSLTGLRISMAQSRPGNVMAPHLPLLSRASSGGPVVQTNTYANGGYFATRRASVSNVGLAADLSHSIRIPAVLFQKHADRRSLDPAEPSAAAAEAQDASASGESPAMKRLQEMISSMRALGPTPPTPKSAEPQAAAGNADEEEGLPPASPADAPESSVPEPAIPQTAPAAHPTSRFDSILEEDEDADDDEANLDADDGSVTVADAHDRAAAVLDRPKTSALYVV